MAELTKLIRELSNADGVPGFEKEVRAQMKELLAPLSDELMQDGLGSIVGKKVGQADGPRVLIAGHLDEVGFMVTSITDKGFLRFQGLGGWWPHVILAQRVKIKTRKGEHVGIVGSKAPHVLTAAEREKVLPMSELFIDVGARNRQEAEDMGIRPGDPIVPISEFFEMRDGELWAGKALDNRIGCALAVEVMRRLQGEAHPNVLFAGGTVQEEVGIRGAATLPNLVQPDIAFALDVGVAMDTPGIDPERATPLMGEGPLLFILDATMVPHVGLRDLVMDTAEELGIKLQTDALMGGGTDAGRFHISGKGVPSLAIGFATRYIHSHTAVLSRKDFEQLATLITEVIKRLDAETLEAWRNE